MGDLMARPLHSSAPCHKFFSNIHANSFCSFSLCLHYFVLSLATLSLPFPVPVIQRLCFYTERNPCFIHTTVLLIGPTFLVVLSHTFRSCLMSSFYILMFSLHTLMLCTSLLSFHLQSACTFSKSILRCIHKVVKVTVSYIVCVPLSLYRTTQLPLSRFL
jgi:hypothetical protein